MTEILFFSYIGCHIIIYKLKLNICTYLLILYNDIKIQYADSNALLRWNCRSDVISRLQKYFLQEDLLENLIFILLFMIYFACLYTIDI